MIAAYRFLDVCPIMQCVMQEAGVRKKHVMVRQDKNI
jgi:hypothetical protein